MGKLISFIFLTFFLICANAAENQLPTYYGGRSYQPPKLNKKLQAYLTHYVCPEGRIPDITFSVAQPDQGSGDTTQIQGKLQPKAIGGSPSNTYVGVNLGTKDVIYITKMTVGRKVVGFNISLLLCRSKTPTYKINAGSDISIPLIDTTRMPTVSGASPIIVSDQTKCGIGSVDQGAVVLNLPAYKVPGKPGAIIKATQTKISFTRATCL